MAAKKKVYAVKKGKVTGLFYTWDECKESVDGYPGAEYKGFATMEEARQYLGISAPEEFVESSSDADTLVVYVDGSYEDSIKKYAFGCVFLVPDGRILVQYGNGDNEQSLQHRNVTGEMLGAMYAVKTAMYNGFKRVELYYDYQGIEKWVTGEWKAKTELTQLYAKSMKEWAQRIGIGFHKVAAHTNIEYNEMADQMAKTGLVNGDGIPKVMKLDELKRIENV